MNRKQTTDLESTLRQEARTMHHDTKFSPILHERIMAALRREGLSAQPLAKEPSGILWRICLATAAAAAIAIVAWIALRSTSDEKPAPKNIVQKISPIPGIPQAPQVVARPVDSTTAALDKGKYAYLDRDAQKLVSFVTNQFPSFPTQPPK